ncbi:hypothetical protein OIU76_014562 [Salix suchowensis]|nr:hypothetical protein OIU76_014562 [Salix suchowensis]
MASQGDAALDIRRKKISGQQKREALEREISMLEKMLKQEENVHEILNRIHNKDDVSAIPFPDFLPPKMKELLAELVMVDGRDSSIGRPNKPASTGSETRRGSVQDKMAFETKALHFISKAIKGDYNLNDFNPNEKIGASRVFSDQKENHFHEEVKPQDKVPKKSGILKAPSPLRDPRHPSPMPRERNAQPPLDLLSKSLSNSILSEDNIQQLQPNRLSENIMRCLNFIYVRLLRTSRAMELEKSGPRESRQQDPYGIFNVEESIPRDIGPYKNLVIFTSSSMDPKWISHASSIPLLKKLRVLMNNLQTVDLRFLTRHQKLAFWINMYNACIMHGFIQYGVPSTPEKLFTLINKATLNVGGNTINAQAIEHYILRKPTSSNEVNQKKEKDDKEAVVRKLYGLESVDPNITFALCCGTRSSPAVRVYTAEGVISELEKSKLEYLQASVVVTSTKKIAFPDLLLRNTLDFAMDTDTLVEWLCHHLPTSGTLRKSIVDCFRGHNIGKIPCITVEKIPYDFEFQYLLAI